MPVPTTFVIGAGASVPFNLPTGGGLRDGILNDPPLKYSPPPRNRVDLSEPSDYQEILSGQAKEEAKSFASAFRASGLSSVDRFLERNKDQLAYGKFAIAKTLHELEASALRSGQITSNWHSWLIERLLARADSLFAGDFTFITFNYDRLFFASLYLMIRYGLKQDPAKAMELARSVPVIHVYGKFDYPLENMLQRDRLSGYIPRIPDFEAAASGIHLISDQRDPQDEVCKSCKDAISKSHRVVFLGFGFDKLNSERIGVIDIANRRNPACDVYANAFQTLGAERRRMLNMLGANARIGSPDHACLDFLRANVADWIEE